LKPNDRLQWTMVFHVWHAADYGHKLQIVTYNAYNSDGKYYDAGTWKGLGIPGAVLEQARSLADGILSEQLITRYGVQEELPVKWAGEPDPF